MQKILSVLVAVALFAIATPSASAETVTADYTGSAGFYVVATGLSLMCPAGCMGVEEFPNFGGAHLTTSGAVYTNVIVTVSDDVYGNTAANSACFWNPDGDNICDGDDNGSDWTCGTVAIIGSEFAGDYATVWALTLLVSEDLDVCGAVGGTISGDFF